LFSVLASLESPSSGVDVTFRRANNKPLPASHRVDNGVLTVFNVQKEDGGEYACVGSSAAGGQILFTVYHEVYIIG
jgi:hypothetical protein